METSRVGTMGLRVPRVWPWSTNPAAGEEAADALPADKAGTNARTSPSGRCGDRTASRLYIRRADMQKYGYSMICLGARRRPRLQRHLCETPHIVLHTDCAFVMKDSTLLLLRQKVKMGPNAS